MVKKALYETRVLYTLDLPHVSRYVNLDFVGEVHVKNGIVDFSNEHMVHCNWDRGANIGSFIVGSANGSWSALPHVNRVLSESLSRLHPAHAETKRKDGRLVVGRVVEILDHGKDPQCVHHPHELFANMRIESIGESPFQHSKDVKEEYINDLIPYDLIS